MALKHLVSSFAPISCSILKGNLLPHSVQVQTARLEPKVQHDIAVVATAKMVQTAQSEPSVECDIVVEATAEIVQTARFEP